MEVSGPRASESTLHGEMGEGQREKREETKTANFCSANTGFRGHGGWEDGQEQAGGRGWESGLYLLLSISPPQHWE